METAVKKWKHEQPISDPCPSGASSGSRRCCLVSKKVQSGKLEPDFFSSLIAHCPSFEVHP
jgi:hypothetical protein